MSALEASLASDNASIAADEVKASNQFVTFRVGETAYGIDIMTVREIRSWTPTTQLPGRTSAARGVLDIRGQVIEVYDLAVVLGGAPTEANPEQVIIVVALGDTDVGLLVDAVSDIIFVSQADMLEPPEDGHSAGAAGQIATMVNHDDKLTAILNAGALFG